MVRPQWEAYAAFFFPREALGNESLNGPPTARPFLCAFWPKVGQADKIYPSSNPHMVAFSEPLNGLCTYFIE